MTRSIFIILSIFVMSLLTSCFENEEYKEFELAKERDTIESYTKYLEYYSTGKYKKIAIQRLFSIEVNNELGEFVDYLKTYETKPGRPKKAPSGVAFMSESNALIVLSAKYDKEGNYKYILDNDDIAEANKRLRILAIGLKGWRKIASISLNKFTKPKLTEEETKAFAEDINVTVKIWNALTYPDMQKEFKLLQNSLKSYETVYKNTKIKDFNTEYVDMASHFFRLRGKNLANLDLSKSLKQLKIHAINIKSWPIDSQDSAEQIIDRVNEIVAMEIQDNSKLVTYTGDIGLLVKRFFDKTKTLSEK